MTRISISAATAIIGMFLFIGSNASKADSLIQTMKPTHGISFDVGSQRAVSYFLKRDGQCKLVMTLASEPDWDGNSLFTPSRFQAAVPAGQLTRYESSEGSTLEFRCLAEAEAMTVRQLDRFAAGSRR